MLGIFAVWQRDIVFAMMGEDLRIRKVEKDGEDGLIVTFSDGTITGYVAEELLLLRPCRERAEEPVNFQIIYPCCVQGTHDLLLP